MRSAPSLERCLLFTSAFLSGMCGIAELDVTGKRCPCPSGYFCDLATDTCQRGAPTDAGIDSSVTDAAIDADADAPEPSCPAVDLPPPTTISSGRRHVCSIRAGELWCWGGNSAGQLGLGNTTGTTTPTQVGTDANWVQVSALADHTCAINADSRLFCWGENTVGQVGVGNVDPQLSPVSVDINRSWARASAGQGISCAITTGQELYCWGTDAGGAAGTGQATGMQASPYPVNSTLEIAQVGAGTYNGCAVATDGGLYCWGQTDCFKTASSTNLLTPTRIGDGCWRQSAGGHRHTCAIDSDGRLLCWGGNQLGVVGIGVLGQGMDDGLGCTDAYLEPQPVLPNVRWLSVAASYLSSCAISEDHELYCWGYNEWFGVSSTPGSVLAPTKVNGDTDWAEAAPGQFHTCAKKQNGDVWCMGGAGDVGPTNGPLVQVSF